MTPDPERATRRTPPRRRASAPVVAVTGAAGPTGRAVLRALATAGDTTPRLIAIDSPERTDTPQLAERMAAEAGLGVAWHRSDPSSPLVVDALAGADAVVHVAAADELEHVLGEPAAARRLRAVRAAQAVTTAAAAVGARRLVAVTSAMVFGARADNPVPLPDDADVRAEADGGLVGDLLEVERVLARTPRVHPGLALTVIRPAAMVGPGVDTAVTRHFEAPRLLVLRGTHTRWQFCHVDDLAAAVVTVLRDGLEGWLTAGSSGSLDAEEVEHLSGMRRLEVPAGLAFSTAERLHRVGVLPTPGSDLAYVVHPWVVDSGTLRAAGWRADHDNEACLRELVGEVAGRRTLAGRRVDRRDAAMGAAGAAVALLGTAAIVRQARSRQTRRRRGTTEG